METRFENRYTLTKSVVREFKYRMLKPVLTAVLAGVFGAIMIALGVYAHETHKILLGVVLLILGAMFIVVTEADINRTWKMMCEQANHKPIEAIVTFTDEKAVNASRGMESRIELDYADIKKVVVTKNLIVLVTKAKLGHMLRRDSFTVGDEKGFLEFIEQKKSLAALPKDAS